MHIVLVTADNQPPDLLGCYGNREVKTPHIDALAGDGVRLDRFHATNGMCSPGRASLLTGLMPSQHGIHSWLRDVDLRSWPDDWSAIGEFPSLATALNENGYRTVMVGKHHLGQPSRIIPGFEEMVTFVSGHTENFYDNLVFDRGTSYRVKDRHIVDYFTEKAVATIDQADTDKPLFLMVNYDAPYLLPPTNLGPDPRNRFYKDYQDCKFESFPRCAISDEILKLIRGPDDPSRFGRHMLYSFLRMHNDPASMANVCAQIAIVDDGVGQLLAALDRRGWLDDTLFIFTGDQANLYGQHGLWGHTIQTQPSHLYDVALRIPFIVRQGGLPTATASDGLFSQIDLPATVCDLVGIKAAFSASEGQSFASALKSGDGCNGAVFFEQEESRGIRVPGFAYWARLPGTGSDVLYDHQRDPGETVNVIDDPEYAAVAARLRQQIVSFFEKVADPRFDIWNGGQAKGSVSSETFLRPFMPEGWVATTTS